MVEKLWRYVKPFSSNIGVRTDRQTDIIAISISRVSVLTRDKKCRMLCGTVYTASNKCRCLSDAADRKTVIYSSVDRRKLCVVRRMRTKAISSAISCLVMAKKPSCVSARGKRLNDRRLSITSLVTCIDKRIQQVRQQDAYLVIRPAYSRGCCPRAANGDKTYLQPVFLHR